MPERAAPEWYAGGLRFECTGCGECCTGPPGYVHFSDEEAQAMAARVGLTPEQFRKAYARKTSMGWSLRERKTPHGYDCVFLDRITEPGKALCKVYEDRPTQCRTFPWWPEVLASEKSWKLTARQCEGIGRGGFVPIERIRIERDRTPK
ncbi:MAG: YkgJ family cysteine cluster protein [Phycisphaeraceae bacterium]|nr:YkgJ family cysteine cluster protein [Phycisphaeraceae bacterium]